MFTIPSADLQEVVTKMVSGAKRARLAQGHLFVSASKNEQLVRIYFVGENLQVEKAIKAKVEKDLDFSTSVLEFNLKASALPNDVEVNLEKNEKGNIQLKWGRSSEIVMLTTPETSNQIQKPNVIATIQWGSGKLHNFARNFSGFCALQNSEVVKRYPVFQGVYFKKDDTDEVVIEATNSIRAIRTVQSIEWFEEPFAIHAEALNSLAEVISSESDVKLSLSANKTLLIVESGNTTAIVRLLAGIFPDMSSHFTDESAEIVWRADRMQLLETARRVKRLGGTRPVIRVFCEGTKQYAVLDGVLTEQIGAVIETPTKEGFSLNSENLEAALSVLRSEEVLITFKGPIQPLTVFSGDDDTTENLAVMLAQVNE